MCMKNVNTDVTFFTTANISNNPNIINLIEAKKDVPTLLAKKIDNHTLVIPELNFLLSINANERSGNNPHETIDTPENTLFFNETYRIRLRITETSSGNFLDLSTQIIEPSKENINLCRKLFFKKITCNYQNICVTAPPENKDLCVLKVLIQHVSKDPNLQSSEWIVQSIHPMRLEITDTI